MGMDESLLTGESVLTAGQSPGSSGSSSSVLAPFALGADWFGLMANIFASRTQLSPLQWAAETSAASSEDFNTKDTDWGNDVNASGAGASVLPATVGSVAAILGPNAATAGFAYWYPGAGSADATLISDQIWSVRQRRWMVAFRAQCRVNTANGNPFAIGVAQVTGAVVNHKLGLGTPNVVPSNNWCVTLDGVNLFDTGVVLLPNGGLPNQFLISAYIGCFDFRNLVCNLNPGLSADQVATTMDHVAEMSGRPFAGVDSAGGNLAQQGIYIDKIVCFKEL